MSLAEPIDEARGSYEFPTRSLNLLTFQAMKQAGELWRHLAHLVFSENASKSANVKIGSGSARGRGGRSCARSLVLITFVALSLSPTAARAGANGSWCANYGTGLDGSINCSYTSFEQCRATPNPYPGTGYGRGGRQRRRNVPSRPPVLALGCQRDDQIAMT